MNTSSLQKFEVQNTKAFLQDILDIFSSARAEDTIWVQSMLFEPGQHTESIVEALCKAKGNGASVYVLIDSFGILTTEEVPMKSLFLTSIPPKILKKDAEKKKLINRLKNVGIDFCITGSMGKIKSTFPIAFCNHRKSYGLINEKRGKYYTWITGVNIADTSFAYFDLAIKIYHEKLIKKIYEKFLDDYYGRNQWQNNTYTIDTNDKYLIENNSNVSNIRKEAYSLISNAEKFIRFVTQYPPDPFLLSEFIKKAKQGIKIEIITSDIKDEFNSRTVFNIFNTNFNNKLKLFPNMKRGYFPGKVHAKLLFSEKELLIGSDNIIIISKILQTKENMLYISHNESLTSQLNKFFNLGWDTARKNY